MKYNLADPKELGDALEYVSKLSSQEAIVEIRKIIKTRSLNQNNYLHLLLGAFGAHFGYTLEEAKILYKKVNRPLYYYTKKGREFIRSSADLNQEEMSKSIDIFRAVSAEQGCELPLATDQEWLRQIENDIERNNYYL